MKTTFDLFYYFPSVDVVSVLDTNANKSRSINVSVLSLKRCYFMNLDLTFSHFFSEETLHNAFQLCCYC